jgi:hypothetical protein
VKLHFLPIVTAALLTLAACEEKKPEVKPEEPASKSATTTNAAATATATAAATPVTINDSDLSTPADFEESAEKAITKANYKTELSSIEADIAKD